MSGRDPTKTLPRGKPAWSRSGDIGDYDGAPDKENSITEADVPYAWTWYQDYTAMLGSSFTSLQSGIVHAQKLAIARFEAGKTRAVERAIANSIPSTADELLGDWAKAMSVPVYDGDQSYQVRRRCAAKLEASLGPTVTATDDALIELLGDTYVESIRTIGASLSVPPTQTFWPTVNTGDPAFSLGGGAWLSERANLVVRLQYPKAGELGAFLKLANIDLFQHLDRVLPAWATFNWAGWATDIIGFYLDGAHDSRLDLTALTNS